MLLAMNKEIEMKVDRTLLSPAFEGYKLTFAEDQFSMSSKTIPGGGLAVVGPN